MKKLLVCLLMLALVLLSAAAEEADLRFTTVDMDGNEVTEAIFADYDVTMVNIWATWCGYCVEEMPIFATLKDSLPENANLITICEDAADDPELASQILQAAGANYVTLQANEEIYRQILRGVYGFPTTIFLDSEGKAIGDAIVGVPSTKASKALNAYYQAIALRLELLK